MSLERDVKMLAHFTPLSSALCPKNLFKNPFTRYFPPAACIIRIKHVYT